MKVKTGFIVKVKSSLPLNYGAKGFTRLPKHSSGQVENTRFWFQTRVRTRVDEGGGAGALLPGYGHQRSTCV